MMESLRGAATGWVAKVLIGLLALSFGIWGINDVFRGYRSDVLASVGDFQISSENFRRTFEQQLRRISRQSGQSIRPSAPPNWGLTGRFWARCYATVRCSSRHAKLKLAVPDALVAQEIAKNPTFQNTRGDFDANRFRQILQQNGLNEQMFLLEERGQKLRQAAAEPVIAQLSSPDTLVTAILRHANEQRDARYFVLNANESEVPAPTEAELKAFYEAHPQLFTAPAYRSLTLLKIEPQDLAPAISVSEEDLVKAYEAHRADYGTPERRTVQQLTFATLEEAKAATTYQPGNRFFCARSREGLAGEGYYAGRSQPRRNSRQGGRRRGIRACARNGKRACPRAAGYRSPPGDESYPGN